MTFAKIKSKGKKKRERRKKERSTHVMLPILLSDYKLTAHLPAGKGGSDPGHVVLAYLVIVLPFAN